MTALDEEGGKEAEEKELYDAFTELGSDPELSDIEFAFQDQAEVALRDQLQPSHCRGGRHERQDDDSDDGRQRLPPKPHRVHHGTRHGPRRNGPQAFSESMIQ